MKQIKYFIPSIILMIIIFMFSNQNSSESSQMSNSLLLWIQNVLHIPFTEFIVRKLAHMSEYALLCLTFIYGFYKNKLSIKNTLLLSISCSFLYACSDEIHQLFISGRACQFTDVLIDTSGAIIMCLFFYLLTKKVYHSR